MLRSTVVGGEALQRILQEYQANVKDGTLRVGFPEDATCGEDGTASAPYVASLLEYGTLRIPPRPFMRNCVQKRAARWSRIIAAGIRARILSNFILDTLGKEMVEDIQREMDDFSDPPNAPATIRQKGFNNPLIDTGRLRDAVTYEVEDGLA